MLWWILWRAKSSDRQARRNAIPGLLHAGNQKAIDALLVLCNDKDKDVAIDSFVALLSLGGEAEKQLGDKIVKISMPHGYDLDRNLTSFILAHPNNLSTTSRLQPNTIATLTSHSIRNFEKYGVREAVVKKQATVPSMVFGIHAFANPPSSGPVWNDIQPDWLMVIQAISHLAAFSPLLNKVLDDSQLSCHPRDSQKVLLAKKHFSEALETIILKNTDSISDQDLVRLAELRLKEQLFYIEDLETHNMYHRTSTKDVPEPPVVKLARDILTKRGMGYAP
jgi:hypothetical protein